LKHFESESVATAAQLLIEPLPVREAHTNASRRSNLPPIPRTTFSAAAIYIASCSLSVANSKNRSWWEDMLPMHTCPLLWDSPTVA